MGCPELGKREEGSSPGDWEKAGDEWVFGETGLRTGGRFY